MEVVKKRNKHDEEELDAKIRRIRQENKLREQRRREVEEDARSEQASGSELARVSTYVKRTNAVPYNKAEPVADHIPFQGSITRDTAPQKLPSCNKSNYHQPNKLFSSSSAHNDLGSDLSHYSARAGSRANQSTKFNSRGSKPRLNLSVHESPGHQSVGHESPGHQSVGHKSPGHKSVGHESPGHQSVGHKSVGHESPGTKSVGHDSLSQQLVCQKSPDHSAVLTASLNDCETHSISSPTEKKLTGSSCDGDDDDDGGSRPSSVSPITALLMNAGSSYCSVRDDEMMMKRDDERVCDDGVVLLHQADLTKPPPAISMKTSSLRSQHTLEKCVSPVVSDGNESLERARRLVQQCLSSGVAISAGVPSSPSEMQSAERYCDRAPTGRGESCLLSRDLRPQIDGERTVVNQSRGAIEPALGTDIADRWDRESANSITAVAHVSLQHHQGQQDQRSHCREPQLRTHALYDQQHRQLTQPCSLSQSRSSRTDNCVKPSSTSAGPRALVARRHSPLPADSAQCAASVPSHPAGRVQCVTFVDGQVVTDLDPSVFKITDIRLK